MDTKISVGDIVISLSGHDKNQPFIVTTIDKNGYCGIIDGRYRLKDKPKHKNPKHLKIVAHSEEILNKVQSPLSTNAEIYKLIKVYKEIKE